MSAPNQPKTILANHMSLGLDANASPSAGRNAMVAQYNDPGSVLIEPKTGNVSSAHAHNQTTLRSPSVIALKSPLPSHLINGGTGHFGTPPRQTQTFAPGARVSGVQKAYTPKGQLNVYNQLVSAKPRSGRTGKKP